MRQALKLHPDSRCSAVKTIEVDIARPRPGNLELCYVVTGTMSALRLLAATAPARADALWRHTCFEAFLCAPPGAAYWEFNFAPSSQWAAYRFDGYRSGMNNASELGAPRIGVRSDGASFELQVLLQWNRLAEEPVWRLGLSAVIEETSGCKSWWALAHPPGKPDFHHPDCFAVELPAPLAP